MSFKRITVVVITYNQETVIGRALESILKQKEWGLHCIVICDDKSTDNNWDVIQKYKEDYPSFIDSHRNETNKGIYGNLQLALSYIQDTDLIIMCSGDDALCDGYFKRVQEYIEENNIDISMPISIFSDWKSMSPTGKEDFFSNKNICSKLGPFSAKLRGLVYNRSVFNTLKVIKRFTPLPLEKGLAISEGVFDLMTELYTEKIYYMPYVGSIYFSGIGISTKLNNAKYLLEEAQKWKYYIAVFDLSKKDKAFCEYNYYFCKFMVHPSFINYYNTLKFYCLSIPYLDRKSIYEFLFLFACLTKRIVIRKCAS